jgi:hypothetical protein
MKVYYHKTWSVLFIVLGSLLILLTLALYFVNGELRFRTIVPGTITFIFGLLYLRNVYFILNEKEIILYGLFGNVARRYSFENYSDIIHDNNKLFIKKNGKLKRIWINRSMCHPNDWNKFLNTIEGNDLSNEIHEVD